MTALHKQSLITITIGLILIAVAAIAGMQTTRSVSAQGDDRPEISGDNSYCLVCHQNTDETLSLNDGTIVNLQYAANITEDFAHAIHTEAGLGCVDCHGENAFPHNDPLPDSATAYLSAYEPLCLDCHASADDPTVVAFGEISSSQLLADTECVTCHLPDDEWATVHPISNNPLENATDTCIACHAATVHEWEMSAHGSQQLACSTCHLVGERALRFEDTQSLCLNCHAASQRTFEHITHQELVCTDCHWEAPQNRTTHILDAGLAQPTGHDVVVETRVCVDCHASESTIALVAQGNDEPFEITSESVLALATEQEIEELEAELEELREEEAGTSTVRLLQGLILGVTLGAILVFVANRWRLYRRVEQNT